MDRNEKEMAFAVLAWLQQQRKWTKDVTQALQSAMKAKWGDNAVTGKFSRKMLVLQRIASEEPTASNSEHSSQSDDNDSDRGSDVDSGTSTSSDSEDNLKKNSAAEARKTGETRTANANDSSSSSSESDSSGSDSDSSDDSDDDEVDAKASMNKNSKKKCTASTQATEVKKLTTKTEYLEKVDCFDDSSSSRRSNDSDIDQDETKESNAYTTAPAPSKVPEKQPALSKKAKANTSSSCGGHSDIDRLRENDKNQKLRTVNAGNKNMPSTKSAPHMAKKSPSNDSSSSDSDTSSSSDSEDEEKPKADSKKTATKLNAVPVHNKKTAGQKSSSSDSSDSSDAGSSDDDDAANGRDCKVHKKRKATDEQTSTPNSRASKIAKKEESYSDSSSSSADSGSSDDDDDSSNNDSIDGSNKMGKGNHKSSNHGNIKRKPQATLPDKDESARKKEHGEKQGDTSSDFNDLSSGISSSSTSDSDSESEKDVKLAIAKLSKKKSTISERGAGKKSTFGDQKVRLLLPNKKARSDGTSAVHEVSPDDHARESDSGVSDVEVSDVSSVDVTCSDESSSSLSDNYSDDESSYSLEDEDGAEERKKTKLAEMAQRAKEAAAAALSWMPSKAKKDTPLVQIITQRGSDGAQALSKGKPFQRVDDEYWGELAFAQGGAMADNSYEGAFGKDGFGAKSSEKLMRVRGKDFRHEKTKRKRSFNGFARTGGMINTECSFSTKYTYDNN